MIDASILSLSLDKILAQIPASILWLALVIFMALVLLISLALMFHWNKYKTYAPANFLIQLIYFIGLIILFFFCGSFLTLFNS